ncbi:MAG: type VI secretion system membrane subunit TssM [Ancalomicrobiaceae bacterium]|nr:type VI secretion system membrane subunit TssM [Ancalomicrobiaceae bacterium]
MGRAAWANLTVVFMAVCALCGLIWYVAPVMAVFGYYPLENPIVRALMMFCFAAVALGYGIYYVYHRIKSQNNLSQGIGGQGAVDADDSDVLKDRMKDALATLKTASKAKGNFLYDLPWYVIIGPPGSGKTTALINSGLNFPLTHGRTPQAIAGVGGTRYCDWWFTEEAVMIDTAGRYTTQDSNAAADQKSWHSFLDILKKNRPRQPINGVIIAISIQDIISLDQAELIAHAGAIRSRLLELHSRLKIDFPVYVVFTKMDLVAGFVEFYGNFGEMQRRMVWGHTFQSAKKNENLIGRVPEEFDALVERMTEFVTDRLQAEVDPSSRLRLFGFPGQMATLKGPVFDFLMRIFEPTRYHANATLRGFYFASGTQQGTPIDRIIGALTRNFRTESLGENYMSGQGRAYFLQDLLKKVIFTESAWVSTDRGAVRRRLIFLSIGYALLLLATVGGVAAWTVSYGNNDKLIAGTELTVGEYKKLAGPMLDEAVISDAKFEKVVPLLEALRRSTTGYDHRGDATPFPETFGLAQRPRLVSATGSAYHAALERFFRPRLLYRMEAVIDAARVQQQINVDRSGLLEAFKVYLMLGRQAPAVDKQLIVNWMQSDWATELYPGPERAGLRKALEDHLVALIDLDNGTGPQVPLNGNLVKDVQQILVRQSLAQRAYGSLKSNVHKAKLRDWVLGRVGTDMATVFTTSDGKGLDSIIVPAFYTYDGFYDGLVDRLPNIASELDRDRWVLGEVGQQAVVKDQLERLPDDILALYAKDFNAAWDQALGRLQIKPLTADRPNYLTLYAISSAASPLKQIFEEIRTQTQLSRERKAPPKDPNAPASAPAPAAAQPALVITSGASTGKQIEDHFRPYYVLVDGGPNSRPIDKLVSTLNDIYQGLTGAANETGPTAQLNTSTVNSIRSMRAQANGFPQPFDKLLRLASDDFEGNVATSIVGELQKTLAEQVTPICKQVVTGRYPFTRGTDKEVPILDFAKLFSPNGVLDRYLQQSLMQYIDTSKPEWSWRKDSKIGTSLSPKPLADFQRAAQIRDAFFAGGGTQPAFTLAVTALTASSAGTTVKLDINGVQIPSPQSPLPAPTIGQPNPLVPQPPPAPPPQPPRPATPVQVIWPGQVGLGRIALTATSDATGTGFTMAEKTGTWALFRMIDQSKVTKGTDRMIVSISGSGRDFQYQFNVGSLINPLTMSGLRDFNCPTSLQ